VIAAFSAPEPANYAIASIAFGAAYRAAFGLIFYAIKIVGIAPLIHLTRGEWREPVSAPGQRLRMRP